MVMVFMIVIKYLLKQKLYKKQNILLQSASFFKKCKKLVKNEIPKQKFQVLSDLKTKILQRAIFYMNFSSTRQILK